MHFKSFKYTCNNHTRLKLTNWLFPTCSQRENEKSCKNMSHKSFKAIFKLSRIFNSVLFNNWRVQWKNGVRDFWLKLNIAKTAANFLSFLLDFALFLRYNIWKNHQFSLGIRLSNTKQRKHFVSLNNETNGVF